MGLHVEQCPTVFLAYAKYFRGALTRLFAKRV
jgi:hypothetical protein